jgi:hypothetical protein
LVSAIGATSGLFSIIVSSLDLNPRLQTGGFSRYFVSLKWASREGEAPILRSQSMSYARGSHTVFQHRYHIVWITNYRYEVLEGGLRERIYPAGAELPILTVRLAGFDRGEV